MPLDLSQADSHDHCWMMDFYTKGCSANDIPTDATLVGVDDVISLTYDGTSKQLSIVVNKVCLCMHVCTVCEYVRVCVCVCMLCVCVCVLCVYGVL